MKKVYTKPVIIIEDFSLSTSIAGTCNVKTYTPNSGTCGFDFGDVVIFLNGVDGCDFKVEADDGRYNGICYHVPTETTDLFNS